MCTDAYRAALTQEFRLRAQPQKNDLEHRGGAAAGSTAGRGPQVALATDAAVVSGEAVDHG
jgi:hypothetical protein